MTTILTLACLGTLFFAGCAQTDTPPSKGPDSSTSAVQEEPLIIGIVPEHRASEQMQRYEPLAGYLSGKLGTKVKFSIPPRYGDAIETFVSAGLDGAFLGSFAYVITHAKLGVEVIARPETDNGVSTYHGLIFVRKESGIRTVGDMRGKTLALVDKATTAGYLWPLVYLKRAGIEEYRTYFRKSYFAGTHEDAILDVMSGKADVGAAKNTVFDRVAARDRRVRDDLVIVARSPEVPENGLALRKGLRLKVGDRLKDVLLTMHRDEEGRKALKKLGAARFVQSADEDYAPVVLLAHEAGLDLATYVYMTE